MTENNLEEFDDLDNLLDDAESGEGGEFSEELDNLLGGDDDLGGDEDAGGGGGDSELDSFFEDLSTIDDLEVLQEDEGGGDEPAPAAAAAAPAAAAEPARAKAPKPKKEKSGGGGFKRFIVLLLSLAILGGGGYAIYAYLFPSFEMPWPVAEKMPEEPPAPVQEEPPPPPPPPPVMRAQQAPPVMRPQAEPEPPAEPAPPVTGPKFGIQVATCLTSTCVNNFKRLLANHNQEAHFRTRKGTTETLELISKTGYSDKVTADEMAARINRGHRLEGNAFVIKAGSSYLISMGNFSDLARANAVKDSLNQRMGGDIMFTTRLIKKPYTLTTVITGHYVGRESAQRALAGLRGKDQRFGEAFLLRE
jgi:cell division septation protein DedD